MLDSTVSILAYFKAVELPLAKIPVSHAIQILIPETSVNATSTVDKPAGDTDRTCFDFRQLLIWQTHN